MEDVVEEVEKEEVETKAVEVDVAMVVEDVVIDGGFTYRYLPPEEWPRLSTLLSYCSPGQSTPVLDPTSQSVIVVETPDGQPVSAVIISGVFHVAYLIPLAQEVNIVRMQEEAERLIPAGSAYYTMIGDGPEADVMRDELGMDRIEMGVAVFVKRTGNGENGT